MADVVDKKTRSRMMAGIRGKNTRPEILVRKGLHARSFRYRLHRKDLPGKPDLVFPGLNAVIFVNGCFWHHHDCHLFKWPSTRPEFWRGKIEGNVMRDIKNRALLSEEGWRILDIWECALKGKTRREPDEVIDMASGWLESETETMSIRGDDGAG